MKRLQRFLLLGLLMLLPACVHSAGPTAISGDFTPGEHTAFFVDVAHEDGVWIAPATLAALGVDVKA
ncbi:MAG TPA: hypothetical protein PLJ24_00810, partial [Anaerolineae bacterium]|nr:hypothetical protein [Anaerolineae bacterium]